MPKEGYKTITVKENVFKALSVFAKERYMTVPKAIEFLIDRGAHNILDSPKEAVKP